METRRMAKKAKKAATNGHGKPGHNRGGSIRLYRKIVELIMILIWTKFAVSSPRKV
jgi:hypothetical protein